MNTDSCEKKAACCDCSRTVVYIIGILGALLVMGGMSWLVIRHSMPPPANTARAQERAKALSDLRAANHETLDAFAQSPVRLSVERAKELTVQEWRNPKAARAEMIARADKANAPAPAKPSEFE
jgi:hypothetical protein